MREPSLSLVSNMSAVFTAKVSRQSSRKVTDLYFCWRRRGRSGDSSIHYTVCYTLLSTFIFNPDYVNIDRLCSCLMWSVFFRFVEETLDLDQSHALFLVRSAVCLGMLYAQAAQYLLLYSHSGSFKWHIGLKGWCRFKGASLWLQT